MEEETRFRFGEAGRETMKNVIAAVLSDFVDSEEKPDDDKVIDEIEEYFEKTPYLYRAGYVWILRALEMAPLAMGYRRQFSNLSREEQVSVLDSFEKSGNYPQRAIILAVKVVVAVNYFSTPEMDRALGYDHRCLLEARGK